MSAKLHSLLESCKPRWDVVGKDFSVSTLAVDLDLISGAIAEKSLYGNADSFFGITYPTETLKTIPRQVFERISGKNPQGKGIFLLGTALGGGKSHILATLYHIAKASGGKHRKEIAELIGDIDLPKIDVIVLTQSSPAGGKDSPKTLWGEIAHKLGQLSLMKEWDVRLQAPPKDVMRKLLHDKRVLILIDEMTNYMIRAAAITTGDSNLAVQTRVFLQDLEEVVDQLTTAAMVISQLPEEFDPEHKKAIEKTAKGKKADKEEFEERVRHEIGITSQILLRKAETVIPVRDDNELINILKRRLFESIDEEAARKTSEAYLTYYRTPGVRAMLPIYSASDEYRDKLMRAYPFHPKFIMILRDKLSQAPKFMQTRGALNLSILALRKFYHEKRKDALLHPFHIDTRSTDIREELSQRVFDDPKLDSAMVTEFMDGPDGRARAGMVDDIFGGELGTRLSTSILLESCLVTHRGPKDSLVGADEAEILLGSLVPDDDEVRAHQALIDGILQTSYHIEKSQDKYVFRGEVNLNRYIDEKAQHIPDHEVESKIRAEFESIVLKGSSIFEKKIFWPTSPEDIDDRPRLQLVVLAPTDPWWHDSEEPNAKLKQLFEKKTQAKEARRYKNSVVFLAPLGSEREKLFNAMRRHLAIETISSDDSLVSNLTEEQKRKLEEDRAKSRAMAILRMGMTYRRLFYPTGEGKYRKPVLSAKTISLAERDLGIDTDSWKVGESRLLKIITERLKDEEKLREEAPFSPDWLRDRVFTKESGKVLGSIKYSDIENAFYEDPSLPFLYPKDLLRRSVEDGVRQGSLAVLSGERFFTPALHSKTGESPVIHDDSEIVLCDSERYDKLLSEYHDSCGLPRSKCRCVAAPAPTIARCAACGEPQESCRCEISQDVILRDAPGLIAGELKKRNATAREVSIEVSRPVDVAHVLKMIPSFGPAKAKPELSEINITAEIRKGEQSGSVTLRGSSPGDLWDIVKGTADSLLAQISSGKATGSASLGLLIRMREPLPAESIERVLQPLVFSGSETIKARVKVRPEVKA